MRKKKPSRVKSLDKNLYRIAILVTSIVFISLLWQFRTDLDRFESWGYLGLFLVNVFANSTVVFPLPSVATVFIGGSLWNPILVGIISGVGSAIGDLAGFFIGFGSRGVLNYINNEEKFLLHRFEKWFRKNGFVTVAFLAALPDPVFDLIGIMAGTFNYPLWKFFLATALGRIFRNILVAWTGSKMIS
ncbi:VTT domain-containing protein [Patescibacteria group bacterium]|nr:VTT domain-containing protein [Patescibacteria group bacterium]MCL5797782.1 VTT domain-containing protein [Patescibacteria group bacterium]